jgi:hypothetical protein
MLNNFNVRAFINLPKSLPVFDVYFTLVPVLDYVTSNGTVTDEWWMGKDSEGNCGVLIGVHIPEFTWRDWGKSRKT